MLTMELRRALAQLARTPRLLVACDHDGTLAGIIAGPQRAVPVPESVTALRSLAALPATTTAGSRPVRISNAANQQVQLDVFGPVVELVVDLAECRGN